MTIWLVGAGPMAQDYARVLLSLGESFEVIGRGDGSGRAFHLATGVPVHAGGIQLALNSMSAPTLAIVAVGVEELAATATALIKAGTQRILLEKPGGIYFAEVETLSQLSSFHGAEVLLAYNRRFYASTLKAKEYIKEDGGLLSAQFEFTEWAHKIEPLKKGRGVKEHWLLANSSHVIDLAFHFCGRPLEWRGWHAGTLNWHPNAARFCGAGVTRKGVLFSYLADWQAPGRWSLELLTRKRRLILRPMEQLQVTPLGTVEVQSVDLDDSLDRTFKPGLYLQTNAFLTGRSEDFCDLAEQVYNLGLYSEMGGYKKIYA